MSIIGQCLFSAARTSWRILKQYNHSPQLYIYNTYAKKHTQTLFVIDINYQNFRSRNVLDPSRKKYDPDNLTKELIRDLKCLNQFFSVLWVIENEADISIFKIVEPHYFINM